MAKRVDAPSLYYGCLKALQATQDARRELAGIELPPGFDFRLETLAYPSLLLIQYIAAAAVARSFGIRFLGNVLAVAQTHKIVS